MGKGRRRNGLRLNSEWHVWGSHMMITEKGKGGTAKINRKWWRENA
jgi:hypothetical protein